MGNVNLFCKCGHTENEHLISRCDVCDCEKYESMGRSYDDYKPVKLEDVRNAK
jgi:hypothetical protein